MIYVGHGYGSEMKTSKSKLNLNENGMLLVDSIANQELKCQHILDHKMTYDLKLIWGGDPLIYCNLNFGP